MENAPALIDLMRAIALKDGSSLPMLDAAPALALEALRGGATRDNPTDWFLDSAQHYVYAGDTALHVAAAAYDAQTATKLLSFGANPNAANRRGATPLHYACDGVPGSATWDPAAQAAVVTLLIASGANVSTLDKGGVAPLHRAVRNRCASAVAALLEAGADPTAPNRNGSTPLDLAQQTTGRGGTGTPAARSEQQAIIALLDARGAPETKTK